MVDVTYLLALALAIIVGFVVSLGRSLLGRTVRSRMALLALLAADLLLLIDWSALTPAASWMSLIDVVFFTLYSVVGILIGSAPVSIMEAIIDWLRRRR